MPFRSKAQSALIHAKANEGVSWAKKFIADAHGTKVPTVKYVKHRIGKPRQRGG